MLKQIVKKKFCFCSLSQQLSEKTSKRNTITGEYVCELALFTHYRALFFVCLHAVCCHCVYGYEEMRTE